MSPTSVLLASGSGVSSGSSDASRTAAPTYTLLLTTDQSLIEEAQRLRYEVFTSEPGFELTSTSDADRFDQYCDHLLVREDVSGDLGGCYRLLPPPRARPGAGGHHPH